MLRVWFGWKVSGAHFFTVKMARWKLCSWTTFEIWPLSTGALCQKKSYTITPKAFNRFSKSLHHLEDGGHLIGKFKVRRYFTFAMVMWKLCASTTFEILLLSTVHCASKNPISPNIFNRFSKSLASARWCWGSALGGKLQMCRYFSFAMGRWKICASTTFESLPLSTCALCQKKCYISKGVLPIFEIFASAQRCWGWAFGRKVSCAQNFYC